MEDYKGVINSFVWTTLLDNITGLAINVEMFWQYFLGKTMLECKTFAYYVSLSKGATPIVPLKIKDSPVDLQKNGTPYNRNAGNN